MLSCVFFPVTVVAQLAPFVIVPLAAHARVSGICTQLGSSAVANKLAKTGDFNLQRSFVFDTLHTLIVCDNAQVL